MESGSFDVHALVLEAGFHCSSCQRQDCARPHGKWLRAQIFDLVSGELFQNLPIQRVKFCDGSTRSLFPAELWRGKATISSVLGVVANANNGDVEKALQQIVANADGEEPVSERSIRRWMKHSFDRISVADKTLNFPQDQNCAAYTQLQSFLSNLELRDLLTLRQKWGYSLLDKAPLPKQTRSTSSPRPGFQNPCNPQSPPSEYHPRGTRWHCHHRGRSPDDTMEVES